MRLLTVPEMALTELVRKELGFRVMSRAPISMREKIRRKDGSGRFTDSKLAHL